MSHPYLQDYSILRGIFLRELEGVVGWGKGFVYLTSLGRPTEIGKVGQGLLSLQQTRIEVGCFYFFCFFSFIHFPHPPLSLSFISSTISSSSLLPVSGRWHKMTHASWRVVKPQHNQSKGTGYAWLIFHHFIQGRQLLWFPFCFHAHQSSSEKVSKGKEFDPL